MREIIQNPNDLVYYFFEQISGHLNLDELTVLTQQDFQVKGQAGLIYTMKLAIIGESHFWLLSDNNGRPLLAEVLACVSSDFRFTLEPKFSFPGSVLVNLTAKNKVYHQRFRQVLPGIDYCLTLRTYSFPDQRIRNQMTKQSEGLCYLFPGKEQPRTMVTLESDQQSLLNLVISTLHEYPHEDQFLNLSVFSTGSFVPSATAASV